MRIDFMEDEMLILVMYQADTREESLDLMEEALFELEQDPAMAQLLGETINKLTQITNDEYLQIGFSKYDEALDAIVEESYEDNEPTVNLGEVGQNE